MLVIIVWIFWCYHMRCWFHLSMKVLAPQQRWVLERWSFGLTTMRGFWCHHSMKVSMPPQKWGSQRWRFGLTIVRIFRCTKVLVPSKRWGIDSLTMIRLQYYYNDEDLSAITVISERKKKQGWFYGRVSSQECKSLGYLIFNLLQEQFWPGFPLELGFSPASVPTSCVLFYLFLGISIDNNKK